MLAYMTGIAWRSMRRNPWLTLLLVGGIALGIAVSNSFVTVMYIMAGHPIPHKEGSLFYVEMDAWDPQRPWDDEEPEVPPDQLTWMDSMAVLASDIPSHKVVMYRSELTIHPESKDIRPWRADTRMCTSDFFSMFEVPFAHGAGWGRDADKGPEPVVVLSFETNNKLFGGENSVGRTLRLEDREFKIAGVLAPWRPVPKYYDTHNGQFNEIEEIYVPLMWAEPMELWSNGNTSNWKSFDWSQFRNILASEAVWTQAWVEMDPSKKEAFLDYLNAYALEQKKLGRYQRPVNNRLLTVREWLDAEEVVPDEARSMLIIGLLFLGVCSVNLIGILLGKFLARAPEVGVRRALGASRRSVFLQHLLECEMVALIGGAVGLVLCFGSLRLIERLFEMSFRLKLDPLMMTTGLGLALVAGLIAGIYPAWRICRVPPALHLKTQ